MMTEEKREHRRMVAKEWYNAHKEERRKHQRDYYHNHREAILKRRKETGLLTWGALR